MPTRIYQAARRTYTSKILHKSSCYPLGRSAYSETVEDTIKYTVEEKPTVMYRVEERETVRYVPREVSCEKPVLVDKIYERPVIIEKEYQLISFKDLDAINQALTAIPKLLEMIPKLVSEIEKFKNIKIVEEVVKVPRIEYIPTVVHRITKTGELIKDAD